MKKQIFVSTILIFAILFCGGVSASETTTNDTNTFESPTIPIESENSISTSDTPSISDQIIINVPKYEPAADMSTIYVPPGVTENVNTGTFYVTIQEAIDAATAGDTIVIGSGTYNESPFLYKQLTIAAAYGANVIINKEYVATYDLPITVSNSDSGDGSGSTIQGLTIKDGIQLINVNHVQIIGNNISSLQYGVLISNDSNYNLILGNNISSLQYGVLISNDSNDNLVSGNTIMNNLIGIVISGSNGNEIQDNTIKSNLENGILITNSSLVNKVSDNSIIHNANAITIKESSDGNKIGDNTITNNELGISIESSDYNRVIGNTIILNPYGVFMSNSDENLVSGNIITGESIHGTTIIISDGSNSNKVIGNNITNNGGYTQGIRIYGGSNGNIITGNTITSNGFNGITIENCNGTKIIDNTINNNGYKRTDNTGQNGIYLLNTGWGTEISENTITQNNYAGILLDGSSVAEIHFNRIVNNGKYGLENRGAGIVNAQNNWWGSILNPTLLILQKGPVKNSGTGKVIANPSLILTIISQPIQTTVGGATAITADLTINSNGENTFELYGKHVPDGIPVNFSTNSGSISPSNINTIDGKAKTTFNSHTPGYAILSVTIDNQTVYRKVRILKDREV